MGLLAGIVPLFLGIVACVGSYQLEIGQLSKPGSGLWPFTLSVMLIGCSCCILIKGARPDHYENFSGNVKAVIYSVIAVAAFIAIFKTLGLLVAVAALLLFQLRIVGAETRRSSLLVTVGMTIAVYLLFSVWLRIPFPGLLS